MPGPDQYVRQYLEAVNLILPRTALQPVRLIAAPPASGKTTFIGATPRSPELMLVDGDTVVRHVIGWPESPDWWLDKPIQAYANAVRTAAVVRYLAALEAASPGQAVVGLYATPTAPASHALPRGSRVALVIPDTPTHVGYAHTRASTLPSEGARAFLSSIDSARERIAFGHPPSSPVFTNFTAALAHVLS